MGKLTGLLDVLVNFFTRKNERHNHALSEIKVLSRAIEEFFTKYGLKGKKSDFRLIFEDRGQAKFDLIAIEYHTRTKIKIAKDIKGKDLTLPLKEIHSDLIEVKRIIFSPILSKIVLGKSLAKLHKSSKNLLEAISDIWYR